MESGRNLAMCELCQYQGLETPATSYCEDCDEPERMCGSCALQHTIPKPFRKHTLNKDLSTLDDHLKKINLNVQGKDTSLNDIPGTPEAVEVKSDSVTLAWQKPEHFDERDRYQIRYKEIKAERWTTHPVEIDKDCTTLVDLKADTELVFQVRTVHMDGEGKYSPISKVVRTPQTPASKLLNFSILTKQGNPSPSRYTVPLSEQKSSRDRDAKCRKFEIGKDGIKHVQEKTIMLVGATGTGKSTLVDGIVNYVLGVNWDDPFRFTAIDLEKEELDKQHNAALSQTEWITCYSIDPYRGSRLSYRLTVIDTPGFGDTRGIDRDGKIVEQIRALFSATNQTGVSCIDSVCFLIKAPDARLTATQKYIFHSIMSLFGKDIEKNICTLVTFADGEDPPVLASLKESKLPFGRHFKFNNSALFTKNTESDSCSLSHIFWDMGCKSFHQFFDYLNKLETKSLQLTKQVLDKRNTLELTVQNLQPQVKLGLSKIAEIENEKILFETHKSEIERNEKFSYTMETTKASTRALPPGKFTTACRHCHTTCHENCAYENDNDKQKCMAFDSTGYCRYCENKCHWKQHSNLPYIYEYTQVIETKTYDDMKTKYEKATGEKLTRERVLQEMSLELQQLEHDIEVAMAIVKQCNEQLDKIALRPNPLSMIEHIDLMISAEKLEHNKGFQERIYALNEMRQKAEIGDHAKKLLTKADEAIQSISDTTKKSGNKILNFVKKFVTGK